MTDPDPLTARLRADRDAARLKALDSLSRNKLWMYGYWASKERQYSALLGESKPSPWLPFVRLARKLRAEGTSAEGGAPAEQGDR